MDFLTKIDINLREKINPFFAPYRRKRIIPGNENFTIISNDCWAGHVYRYFGIPYNTPTIGTGFFADDYIKFVSSLEKYLNEELIMIDVHESKHYEDVLKGSSHFLKCPYARLGDIEVRFGHYNSADEAYNKWNRRRDRMNLDNLIVKMSEHNKCTKEILVAFDALPYQKKFVFTTRDYKLESQVIYKEYLGKDDIKNGTAKFRKYIDLIALVNGKPFKKNQ